MYNQIEIKKHIENLLKLNWGDYKLYLVGGALHKKETKDIDICMIGPYNSSVIFELIDKGTRLGPFDIFYINEDQLGVTKPYTAKSYDRGFPRAQQRKGEWIDGLFWQTWDFPQILTNKPPKLIYNSVII